MADENIKKDAEEGKVDATFLRASAEMRRLEKEALPKGKKIFPTGPIFEHFDVEKISIDSYEKALESAKNTESTGVKGKKEERKEGKKEAEERIITEEELQLIPREKVEVVAREEEEILREERKLKEMKEKFAKLISDIPKEKKKEKMVLEEAAEMAEEKQVVDGARAEEIRQLSEDFKKITMRKEEREKKERIRKMKKEIENMLEEE